MSFLSKIFGDPTKRYIQRVQPTVDKINKLEETFESFSNEKLKEKTGELRERLKKGETLDNLLPEAFALVRESAKKTLKQRHYDVQLIGGIVLHEGKIAEMKTGEGKTLSATLSAFLNALSGKGVHIITVNDYLARRDTVWMGQIYHLLGLSIGCLNHEQAFLYDPSYKKPDTEKEKIRDELGAFKVVEDFLRPCSRKEAYEADITYGTNNEFAFDYLKDNMVFSIEEQVQRGFNYAILDEIDSILIDEARTPLIISRPAEESTKKYYQFARLVDRLKENEHYNLDEKMRSATFTEEGQNKVVEYLGFDPWAEGDIYHVHQLEQALKAKVLFRREKDYVVKDGKVVIVDEFTGRLMPGRRWSGGLHQAIEAKEHEIGGNPEVEVKQESRTLASITFQNYFRMYEKLAGMTGTAVTSAEEFDKVYGLDVIVIPTNKPLQRETLPDRIYKTEEGKFRAVVEEIKKRHEKGQPLLVGTRSIEKNEYLGRLLEKEGIPHQILNAKNHEKEGEIIAQAGRLGQVTIATNMAGRGVDIILGGNPPEKEEQKKVISLGGLHVIGTERHEARRIDDQLRGRAGRQGDPGSSQFFVSLEDEIARIFGGDRIRRLMEILHIPEDQPIEDKRISKLIESAQAKIEGFNFDIRSQVLKYDDVLTKHRQRFYQEREKLLKESNLEEDIVKALENEIRRIISFHCAGDYTEEWNLEEVFEEVRTIFPLDDRCHQRLREITSEKNLQVSQKREKILDLLRKLGEKALRQKEKELGEQNMRKAEKVISLRISDLLWAEHLSAMDHLRDEVRIRAYGGRDPLVEYQSEGHKMFKKLLNIIDSNIIRAIFKAEIKATAEQQRSKPVRIQTTSGKVGRNDPCPCGSGKKYKKCCYPKYG